MSDVRDPDTDQPLPIPNDRPSAHDLVAADLAARKAHGLRKYGSLLQAFNGRDSLRDAYEEALDLCVYLRTLLEEQAGQAPGPLDVLRCVNVRTHGPHAWVTENPDVAWQCPGYRSVTGI